VRVSVAFNVSANLIMLWCNYTYSDNNGGYDDDDDDDENYDDDDNN